MKNIFNILWVLSLLATACLFFKVSYAQSLPNCEGNYIFKCNGRIIYGNGDYFNGQIYNGQPNGPGILIRHIGYKEESFIRIEGIFIYGKAYGTGEIYDSISRTVFKGLIDNDSPVQGELQMTDGSLYTGGVKKVKFDGAGQYIFKNDDKYIMYFLNEYFSGNGILKNSEGKIFKPGLWKDGEFVEKNEIPITKSNLPSKPSLVKKTINTNPKETKCKKLGLAPGGEDYKLCIQ